MIVLINFFIKAIAFLLALNLFWVFLIISLLLWDIKFMAIWSETLEDIKSSKT